MAFELTTTARLLSRETNIQQQIIVEIDGIDLIFSAVPIDKLWRIGDPGAVVGVDGLTIGGTIGDQNGRSYISLSGTTNQITQQLEIDRGGVGSVQKFNVALIDKEQELTQAFQPGVNVPDLLSREANVFLNFQGGAHPEDSIRIFNGIITAQDARPGLWRLTIDHPEFLKRQDLYQQIQTNTVGNITALDSSITVVSTEGFILPQDVQKSYIRIEDELIEYTAFNPSTNTFTGLTRGALGTVANPHDDDSEVTSFYTLSGQALDLALKLMLSNTGNTAFSENNEVSQFQFINGALTVDNGFLQPARTRDNLGLEIGDLVTITGATNAQNNVTESRIIDFRDEPEGTVIIIEDDLVNETDSSAVVAYKSQFNVLGQGCAMKPSQVDVAQHLQLREFFAVSLPNYELYLKDTINAKDFITNEIYFPQGFYQVPRKGRVSVAITQPPLVINELVQLDDTNTKRADNNSMRRQITKDFYNNIVYRFDVDELDDRFRAGEIVFSQKSADRINTGNRTLQIDSAGLRDTPDVRTFIQNQARRFSDRYQFAPERITVDTNYKDGFNVEIADVVLFGNSNLQIPDITNGTRDFQPRLMEVVNKSLNLKTGQVRLSLLDTLQGIDDGRFGVVSPNSFIAAGATTTVIPLKRSFFTPENELERSKWSSFIAQDIVVRSPDYTFSETVRLLQFDPTNTTSLVVNPALSIAPPEDYIVDLPDYNLAVDEFQTNAKAIHVFNDPEVEITAGISNTVFEVAPADISKFFLDSIVIVHSRNFSEVSTTDTSEDDARVTDVDTVLNRITVNRSLGFTPAPGYFVNLIGFAGDQGLPYRYV